MCAIMITLGHLHFVSVGSLLINLIDHFRLENSLCKFNLAVSQIMEVLIVTTFVYHLQMVTVISTCLIPTFNATLDGVDQDVTKVSFNLLFVVFTCCCRPTALCV